MTWNWERLYPVMLYFGRFLNGLAGGVCSVATPTYLGEWYNLSLH